MSLTDGPRAMTGRGRPTWLIGLFLSGLIGLVPINAVTGDFPEQQQLVEKAKLTFERFLNDSASRAWYEKERHDVKAVLIVPQLWRGAFIVGAAGGSGVLLARDFVNKGWSPPAFYRMTNASIGPQAGADTSEAVFVVRTFSVLERFYGVGTMKLGLDAGFTFGSVGEGGASGYDLMSFAWSKGIYAGMSFDGFSITAASGDNEAYYGKAVKPEDILANPSVTNPQADELRATMRKLVP